MRHGSHLDPPNRFESVYREIDFEQLESDESEQLLRPRRMIRYLEDNSKTIVSENDSPDIPFRYSINAYRGCIHGCSYCYARPTHEFLGMNAGLDFETQIVVKHQAAELLRDFLARDSWQPELLMFSGVTDCYQPCEREFQLTRQCVSLLVECRHPFGIITKNALVVRDLDLLQEAARCRLVHCAVSISTLDPALAAAMEPRTSTPTARLRTIRTLAESGVPVHVMAAPMIPGLNDSELPEILTAAREAGAISASYIVLRLPQTVRPVFQEWLERTQPDRSERVLQRIRATREGRLNSSRFNERMLGSGPFANQLRQMFQIFQRRLGYQRLPHLDSTQFTPPQPRSGQLRLF